MANQPKKQPVLLARVNLARVGATRLGFISRHPKKQNPGGGGKSAFNPTQPDPLPADSTVTIEVYE